jgi:hypothetical protein
LPAPCRKRNRAEAPQLEVIGLTMRAAPDAPGVNPPALDVLPAFEPLT